MKHLGQPRILRGLVIEKDRRLLAYLWPPAQSPSFRRRDSHVLQEPRHFGELGGQSDGDSCQVVIVNDGEAEPCEQRVHFVRGER